MIAAAIMQVKKSSTFTREHRKMWDELEDEEKDWDVFKDHFIEKCARCLATKTNKKPPLTPHTALMMSNRKFGDSR